MQTDTQISGTQQARIVFGGQKSGQYSHSLQVQLFDAPFVMLAHGSFAGNDEEHAWQALSVPSGCSSAGVHCLLFFPCSCVADRDSVQQRFEILIDCPAGGADNEGRPVFTQSYRWTSPSVSTHKHPCKHVQLPSLMVKSVLFLSYTSGSFSSFHMKFLKQPSSCNRTNSCTPT